MAGTHLGGKKAAIQNKQLNPDFYRLIGRKGGKISRGGGFASDKIGPDGLTGKERAIIAGVKGGQVSKRNNDYDVMDDYFPTNVAARVKKFLNR